jgi:aspartate ammonia-lyase
MSEPSYRLEHDLIGSLEVPSDALYGVQTQRAVELYPLNGEKPLAAYPELVTSLLLVKKAAARTNVDTGDLPQQLGQAILDAIDSLLEHYPEDQFPVHSFHGGGGISTNMNINEVVANLANKNSFDKPLGSYNPIHPNDHVNLNNSTNDVLATACHLAIINKWKGLNSALEQMSKQFCVQGERWKDIEKISRTCLQDAVEITFADFFSGYDSLIRRNTGRLNSAVSELYQVNLGGNIIGRRGDCSDAFFDNAIASLNQIMKSDQIKRSDNLFDTTQNHDDMTHIASQLELLSRGLLKIAKDFRLMSSGPQTGFSEIILPAVQPGSSAMPGKVNPTIPEFLVQSAMQALGRCHSVQITQDHGELDLNVWESIVINNILDAMTCLESGILVFTTHCLEGLEPNRERNKANINTIIPTVIRLKKLKGYSYASKIFKQTGGDLNAIRQHLRDAEAE